MSLSRDLALCRLLCVDLCFVFKISQIDDDNLPVNQIVVNALREARTRH